MKAWLEARGHGPVEIVQGRSGQFDIELDGQPVYSRYATGRFPGTPDLEGMRIP